MGTGQTGDKEPLTGTGDRGEEIQSKEGRNEDRGCAQNNSECRRRTSQSKGRAKAKQADENGQVRRR